MKFFGLVLLLLAVVGIKGEEDPCLTPREKICQEHLPMEEIVAVIESAGPDAKALEKYCPPVQQFMQCVIEHEELCRPPGADRNVRFDRLLKSLTELGNDLCNSESPLHKAYVRNIDCFLELRDEILACQADSRSLLFPDFYEFLLALNVSAEVVWTDGRCVESYLAYNCTLLKTRASCGDEAQRTVEEIAKRSRALEEQCPEKLMVSLGALFKAYVESVFASEQQEGIEEVFSILQIA